MMKQITLLFIIFFQISISCAASITAQADRNPIQVNESFNLIFEASGSVDDDPDFSPLKNDFSIINQSQSSSISIINGSYNKTTRWTLLLMPKQIGVFTIPSIAFGNDSSPQLRMTVNAEQTSSNGQNSDLFMEVETSTKTTWVQGQIILTVRLLSATNISQFGISKLETSKFDIVSEQLGEDKRYQTTRNNTPYLVFERSFAIFPQQTGRLRIEPFLGEVEVASGSTSYFDRFRRQSTIKRARSQAIEIQISGIPDQFNGKTWLPASELKLVEEWSTDPSQFKTGEPITRTLSLLSNGLTSSQLPELSIPPVTGLKQYPDQPLLKDNKQDDGIIGIRQEKIAVIPTHAGEFILPAIEIPWWNTSIGKMEIARIKQRSIQVAEGTATMTPAPEITSAPQIDITAAPSMTQQQASSSFWFWLSLLLASGWLVTAMLWWLSNRVKKPAKKSTRQSSARSLKQAEQTLHKACKDNNAQACKQALLEWGKLMYGSGLTNLTDIATITGEPLASIIKDLNTSLYSASPGNWSAQDMMPIIHKLQSDKQHKKNVSENELEPMYR
ncbi:MAG: BatD family protein [Gammaproteobacteria bacterium]|nr:BatD family protein [Gammaproteobacteria bacterium]MCW9057239.1 BatD family protein [Gammaproteobacteria bacterium]